MNQNRKNAVESRQTDRVMDSTVCPSLVLDKKVVCDAGKAIFQPSSRLVRESCTNELHKQCPLRCSSAS